MATVNRRDFLKALGLSSATAATACGVLDDNRYFTPVEDLLPYVVKPEQITPGTPTCAGNYSVTRTWTATDDCGNTSTCSRTVVVMDDTPPVISCTDPVSPIDCPALPVFIAATATDDCDPDVAITFADVTTPGTPNCAGNF